jgi:hypothetical protein
VPARSVEHLGPVRQVEQPQDQLNLRVAPLLEHLLVEAEVVVAEDLRPDELLTHG